jgi:hypothetical protein
MQIKIIILSAFAGLCFLSAFSQAHMKDSSVFMTQVKMSYALQFPGGDLKQRFGFNSNLGLDVDFKLKSNWMFGCNGSFIFGNKVKETSVLDPLRTADGNILDANGEYAKIVLYERGFTFGINAGYLLPVLSPNPNSGFFLKIGCGGMIHKIRIEHARNSVPQLEGDYKKGYDRYTTGYTLQQSIGYIFLSNKKLINFFFSAEFIQGFTQNRRSLNFDTGLRDDKKRLDLLNSIRVGWTLPIYARPPKDIYYY